MRIQLILDLRKHGFVDLSHDKNGMAYRKTLPGLTLELCYYITDQYIRLQTTGNGITISLKGVDTIDDIKKLWLLITAEELKPLI